MSLKMASEITHNMYQITYQLPDSKHVKSSLLKMDEQQSELYRIIQIIVLVYFDEYKENKELFATIPLFNKQSTLGIK